jgi:hypothetical protein
MIRHRQVVDQKGRAWDLSNPNVSNLAGTYYRNKVLRIEARHDGVVRFLTYVSTDLFTTSEDVIVEKFIQTLNGIGEEP